jgi:hypothetical protein
MVYNWSDLEWLSVSRKILIMIDDLNLVKEPSISGKQKELNLWSD